MKKNPDRVKAGRSGALARWGAKPRNAVATRVMLLPEALEIVQAIPHADRAPWISAAIVSAKRAEAARESEARA